MSTKFDKKEPQAMNARHCCIVNKYNVAHE